MSVIDDGGPAFPATITLDRETGAHKPHQVGNDDFVMPGMSLRAHFAGLAMQGCLAGHYSQYGHENYWPPSRVADHAVECADALIAALKEAKL